MEWPRVEPSEKPQESLDEWYEGLVAEALARAKRNMAKES